MNVNKFIACDDLSLDINECASHGCLNDATCVDGINAYTCTCKAGYTGEFCATSEFVKIFLSFFNLG